MSITVDELHELADHGRVVTERGEKLGAIGEIYVDDATGAPDWVTVRTGLFGVAETFVPLEAARVEGNELVVPYAKDLVKDAPRIEVDGVLSPQEEQVLYRHYNVGGSLAPAAGDRVAPYEGGDRARPAEDAAMILSEEHLVVGTEQREAGRARLRKYVVTERVTQTVPVRHEEVRLTREPIAVADRDAALPGAVIREEDYEVVLHAETPVVEKTVVPVERVRLDTVTVTGQERVSADVRKEQVELDDPTAAGRSTPGSDEAPTATSTPSTPKNTQKGTQKSTPKGKKGTRRRR